MLRHTKTLTYHLFHLTASAFPWFVILFQVFTWFSAWDYCLFMLIFMTCRILSAHTILTMRMTMTKVSVIVIMLFWIGTVIDHWFINCNTLCKSCKMILASRTLKWIWISENKRKGWRSCSIRWNFLSPTDLTKPILHSTHICYIFLAACFSLCYSFSKPYSYATIFLVENKLEH
jgi:hypothetical protein